MAHSRALTVFHVQLEDPVLTSALEVKMDRVAFSFDPELAATETIVSAAYVPRHSRRLSDKILVAFHHACDVMDLEVAEQLLRLLEMMTTRRPRPEDGNRRRSIEGLVAAHERLWHLRHPQVD